MPGTPEGAAKARESRARKLEELRAREAVAHAVALAGRQQSAPVEQSAHQSAVTDAPSGPRALTAQTLEATAPSAAVLLQRVVMGGVRAPPAVRVQAAGMVLDRTLGSAKVASSDDVVEMTPAQLGATLGAAIAELERRRVMRASPGSVIDVEAEG